MKKETQKRWCIKGSMILFIFGMVLIFFLIQNTYQMTEQAITISTPKGQLTGTMAMPLSISHPVGLIIFVHGDGPTNASYDGAYKPLWEAFAQEGYASLSLDKRGIGGSQGNWLNQSMEDRAQDTRYAIAWARNQPDIDPTHIGLWGASQAGWVIPKVAHNEPDLAFYILVAPAVNWIEQGRYNTRKELEQQGYSNEEIAHIEQQNERVLKLLKQGASYERYIKETRLSDKEMISRERWIFTQKNYSADATLELSAFKRPVHLVLGGRDINVDTANTESVYRTKIPKKLLSITRLPEASHSMLKKSLADSELLTVITAVFAPRKLFEDGYLSDMRQFLNKLTSS